jgi:hypothetical protein
MFPLKQIPGSLPPPQKKEKTNLFLKNKMYLLFGVTFFYVVFTLMTLPFRGPLHGNG